MEEMYCMDGEYSSSENAVHIHDANMQAAGQLPDAPQGMPVDPSSAVSHAMTGRDMEARKVGLS